MKAKIGILILVVVCIGLLVALMATKNSTENERKKSADAVLDLSNQLTQVNANLDELQQVNLALTNELAESRQATMTFSNQAVNAAGTLADTKASLQNAQDQISNLNGRITDLETQNQALDQRAAELTNSITALNAQIADTQKKLVLSETNNAFLEKELQKQLAQKAELERKFNDLDEVRAQAKKLHEELVINRRLRWMRTGMEPGEQKKGAQLLRHPIVSTPPPSSQQYNLDVEVGSDGSVHVIPPTNAPAK